MSIIEIELDFFGCLWSSLFEAQRRKEDDVDCLHYRSVFRFNGQRSFTPLLSFRDTFHLKIRESERQMSIIDWLTSVKTKPFSCKSSRLGIPLTSNDESSACEKRQFFSENLFWKLLCDVWSIHIRYVLFCTQFSCEKNVSFTSFSSSTSKWKSY